MGKAAAMTACVRPLARLAGGARRGRSKTTVGSRRLIWDWLVSCGLTVAAMESTCTYWKPLFYCVRVSIRSRRMPGGGANDGSGSPHSSS